MLLNLSATDFNIKKDELFCDCKAGVLLVCFLSNSCKVCKEIKNALYPISKEFKQIVFAMVSVSKHPQIFDVLNQTKKGFEVVPTFMCFKQGKFDKFVKFSPVFSRETIKKELHTELDDNLFFTKNHKRNKYLKLSEL